NYTYRIYRNAPITPLLAQPLLFTSLCPRCRRRSSSGVRGVWSCSCKEAQMRGDVAVRNTCTVMLVLFGAGMVLAPAAGAITVDGSLSDWGVTIPVVANAPSAAWTSSIGAFAEEDGEVSPGIGGQNYDVEAMYAVVSGDTLFFALVTGFDQGGEAGDIL